ncbi:MAG: hypothetical protein ACI3XO_07385 [Eubacteriales bacterium]
MLIWQGRQLESYTDSESEETFTYTYNSDGIRTSKTIDGVKHIYPMSGTQIATGDGLVPIEDIQPGDLVAEVKR